MEKVYRINQDGSLTGLHDDFLAGLGESSLQRASRVEFDHDRQGWTVQILIGPTAGKFLAGVFARRADAISAEIEHLNNLILAGHLST